MLVKLHSREYEEDYGLLIKGEQPHIHMFDHGLVRLTSKMRPIPVVRVNAVWMSDDLWVRCDVADTEEKKQVGLQSYESLPSRNGLYFPYPGYSDVTFHQGSVAFPLDILFLRDSEIVRIEEMTKVGSRDQWGCAHVDGVIEVNGGFCEKNNVRVGERLALFAFSERDIRDWHTERASGSLLRQLVEGE